MKRARTTGAAACARHSRGSDTAPKRLKMCTDLCTKEDCGGCRASFGWVSPSVALELENHFAKHDAAELERRTPPFATGLAVTYQGAACRFQRYHTKSSRHCIVATEPVAAHGTKIISGVDVRKVSVRGRVCKLPPPELLRQLHFGETEFWQLRKKYRKWVAGFLAWRRAALASLKKGQQGLGGDAAAALQSWLSDSAPTATVAEIEAQLAKVASCAYANDG